jgi:hypothetical protein
LSAAIVVWKGVRRVKKRTQTLAIHAPVLA